MKIGCKTKGLLEAVVGLIFLAVAAWMGLLMFAFASMVDPELSDAERAKIIFRKLVMSEGIVGTVMVLVMGVLGGRMVVRGVWRMIRGAEE